MTPSPRPLPIRQTTAHSNNRSRSHHEDSHHHSSRRSNRRDRRHPLPAATSSACCPSPSTDGVTETQLSYSIGQIAYWAPSHDIVFCYADDDATDNQIPEPGIVHLGTVTSGLEHIASAGNSFTLTITTELAH